jgi:hypothetical protein
MSAAVQNPVNTVEAWWSEVCSECDKIVERNMAGRRREVKPEFRPAADKPLPPLPEEGGIWQEHVCQSKPTERIRFQPEDILPFVKVVLSLKDGDVVLLDSGRVDTGAFFEALATIDRTEENIPDVLFLAVNLKKPALLDESLMVVSCKDGDVVLLDSTRIDCIDLAEQTYKLCNADALPNGPDALWLNVKVKQDASLEEAVKIHPRFSALERLWSAIKAADASGIGYSPETAEACKELREMEKEQ